ncbi:prefoldin subunit beta [Candidatus Woesearchaeota archaeon CG10_big_fil_rev_8_21_14_0_10_37_12]|nr:MAG: prefoldin subunit beta [Candidatus Woesearchaeota archaeon CG10_big_fil_rev_8_21_14_0_10_37_12]
MSSQENMQRLQLLEQNVQAINMQKQQFQAQLFEVESALKEIADSSNAFKLIGGIMVNTDKKSLEVELNGKKDVLTLRIDTLEKQEKSIKDKSKKLRDDIVAAKGE